MPSIFKNIVNWVCQGLLCIIPFATSLAQDGKLEFAQQLTIADGLSHNGVTSILKDSKGYIWIGTYDGLNRYDGNSIKVFRNTSDNDVFVTNRIRTINEDPKGNLWIGTDDGISIYDYASEKFSNIYSHKFIKKALSGPIVRNILFNKSSGLVLCATEGNGLLLFKNDYSYYHQYIPDFNASSKNVIFFNGLQLDDSNYLYSTSVGLVLFTLETRRFTLLLQSEVKSSKSVINVGNQTLLATIDQGIALIKYKAAGNSFSFSLHHKILQEDVFNSAAIDQSRRLWLGSVNNGIIRIDNADAISNNLPFKKEYYKTDKGLLRISCIEPYGATCWVGTFDKGILRFNVEASPFKYYNSEMNYNNALPANDMLFTSPIDSNKVYISSSHGGITLFNTRLNSFKPVPFSLPAGYAHKVTASYVDSKKTLWLQLQNLGLFKIRNGSTVLEKIAQKDFSSLGSIVIHTFTEDKQGNLWIGAVEGVFKLSLNNAGNLTNIEELNQHTFFSTTKMSWVRSVYVDPLYDFIWVGTNADGLIRITVQNNQPLNNAVIDRFIHDKNNPQSISSNFVSDIVRLPGKDLWIGTERGGICKVTHSEGKPVFKAFTEKQGLSNNVVKNIIVENDTTLWITTNNGLNKFNTAESRFIRFDKSNGLPFADFYYSYAHLKNGVIMVTGLDGFCYFNPKDLPSGEMLPGLELGQFKIFNKEISVGDTLAGRVLLNKRLSDLDQVKLKYNENVFSIEVASLHFSTFTNHLVEYQLLPLNKQWVVMPPDQRFIYFSGLPPGNYTLRVRASNSFGKWTAPKVLQIIIAPPFWKTIPAYIFYLLFLALIVYLVVFFLLRYKTLQHNIQIELLEKNTIKEVNDAKLRLFSNISHEIKTPLTLIAGPVDLLSENFKSNTLVKNNLDIVKRQTKKLAQLIDQVNDFQKADANLLKMEYAQFCFDTFINELVADFEFMAINDHKILQVSGETARLYVSADKEKLEKIFNNLITNAFKHTSKGDTIKIEYRQNNRDLVVKVIDSGHGINKEDLPHIFERFFQSRKNTASYFGGFGIGLAFSKQLVEMHYGYINAESELNKGTTMVVRMPIVQTDNIENQDSIEEELLLAEKKADVNDKIDNADIANIQVDKDLLNASVFYAEDNGELRKFVEGILSGFFKVKSFSNGQECLDAMENEWPDIVISDVLMPVLNGFELCKRLKSDLKTSHIPIILLTVSSAIENQLQGLANDADAYITKPFNIEHLVKSVEATLRNRKHLRERFQIDIPLTLENAKENGNDHVFLEKLYRLMADNLDNQDLNLDDFAKDLYLNRTHFYQKVKALTNQTPFELLKLYRLKKAAEMLVQEKLNVNEVFLRTGFKSRTHFSKLFKDKYQVTPSKYAEEASKKFE